MADTQNSQEESPNTPARNGLMSGEEWYRRFLKECEWFEFEPGDDWGDSYREAARKAADLDNN